MSTKDQNPYIDRQALAREVIVSAGNVLLAAGFGRDEIGDFFRQAADLLGGGRPRAGSVPEGREGDDGLAGIRVQFNGCDAVHWLQRLAAEAQALLPLDEGTRLKDGFDTAMQMVPRLAEAQNALRLLAEEAALPLFANRAEWMKKTAAGELPAAAPVVCLEDFETAYQDAFEFIGAVADALLAREDGEAFTFLLGHLADNGVVIGGALQASIARGAKLLGG